MYLVYYDFKELPFQLTPDHRFFFESATHRKAMANLYFGLEQSEGFIVITGEVGAGKTTLVGRLLDTLDPATYITAKIVSSHLQAEDMLRAVAAAFSLPYQHLDKATLLDLIQDFLLQSHSLGKRVLLLVDEAQNVPPPALEELRMLSNFQVDNKVPMQCVMLGQPQFRRILATPDLEQFRQRIIASYHLSAISLSETGDYITHRLTVAGWDGDPAFANGTFAEIYRITQGIPRKINNFCNRLMLHSYLDEKHSIEIADVTSVAEEMATESASLEPALPDSSGIMQTLSRSETVSRPTIGSDERDQRLVKLERIVERHSKVLRYLSAQAASALDLDDKE